jgi:hypothetical protein
VFEFLGTRGVLQAISWTRTWARPQIPRTSRCGKQGLDLRQRHLQRIHGACHVFRRVRGARKPSEAHQMDTLKEEGQG